jgi:hypothetical protein
MANSNIVRGAQPITTSLSASYNAKIVTCATATTDGTALFVGDFVRFTGESDTSGYPIVTQAAATETLIGFVQSFQVSPTNLELLYRTASTARYVQVVMAASSPEFEIQTNGVGVQGDVGGAMDIVVGAGNTTTGLSGMQLNQSSFSTSAAQIQILSLIQRVDNEFGLNAKFRCRINEIQGLI